MRKGRWIAVGWCTAVVGIGSGLLAVVLLEETDGDGVLRYFPYIALACYAVAPFLGAWLSARSAPVPAAAGGLALGIVATVAVASVNQGGSGAMPLALGIAVAGLLALEGTTKALWPRLGAVALISFYALASGRLVSVVFAYPLLGLADELADAIAAAGTKRRTRATS